MEGIVKYVCAQVSNGYSYTDVLQLLSRIPDNPHRAVLLGKDDMLGKYDALVAWGAHDIIDNPLIEPSHGSWWFGHITYDAHEAWTGLISRHDPIIGFARYTLFSPRFVLAFYQGSVYLHFLEEEEREAKQWWMSLQETNGQQRTGNSFVHFEHASSRSDYLEAVQSLMKHLKRGDIYEVNYCQYVYGEAQLNPLGDFFRWMNKTTAPFSAYYQNGDNHLLSASPERFICKRSNRIFAQPIKGTTPRHQNPTIDQQRKAWLKQSEKERAENVMIVDLMRNDLSRLATRNSVNVDELFGVYSFSQVHQMISTISAELRSEVNFPDILRATFPMGSMTGAPKLSAMLLIDKHETHARELYSGSVGYIEPNGDFDFNVVIRSLMYNAHNRFALAGVGSAITYLADPEKEYEECQWKLSTIKKVVE